MKNYSVDKVSLTEANIKSTSGKLLGHVRKLEGDSYLAFLPGWVGVGGMYDTHAESFEKSAYLLISKHYSKQK